MNYEIIPALMPEEYQDIESGAQMVRQQVYTVQLDLMDGNYVPEKTWPFYYDNDYDLEHLQHEDGGFPFWQDVNYELDLMVAKPEERLETWLHVGASRLIFHYQSVHNWEPIAAIDQTTRNFTEIGVAVTIHDNLEDIFRLIDEGIVDFIQVMGISHVGYQGEPFEPQALDIIATLREKYPDLVIAVDGGVSTESIIDLRNAGASRFVSGSGVFGYGIASENIEYFQELLNSTTE